MAVFRLMQYNTRFKKLSFTNARQKKAADAILARHHTLACDDVASMLEMFSRHRHDIAAETHCRFTQEFLAISFTSATPPMRARSALWPPEVLQRLPSSTSYFGRSRAAVA